ncbi:MAG: hypothetical protein ACOCUS_01390 [Polyangiales bacterium]
MALVLGIIGFALLAGIVPAWWLGWRYRERWGTKVAGARQRGAGPYRRGRVIERVPRGVPGVVRAAAIVGTAWGILTLVVMVPLGLCALVGVAGASAWTAIVGVPAFVVLTFDAVALAPLLCAASVSLLRVDGDPDWLRRLTRWTTWHHAGALALMVMMGAVRTQLAFLFLVALVPSLIGLLHACLLQQAVRWMELAQRRMGPP